MLVSLLLLMGPWWMTAADAAGGGQVSGSVATTTIADTVYYADGTPATGTVIVSWGAFTTATGLTVPSGSTSATIGADGVLNATLAPNAGAMPIGSYYTAVYHLDDGSVSREYWVVPASQGTVSLSAIRSTVLPTSVAMQTVSKAYVDTAIAAAVTGHPLDTSNPYVLKAGDTMTGPLVLPGDPTASTQAADKHYVDTNVTALTSGLAQKVSTEPAGTQTVAQPAGTQLQVNLLNGTEYASQYQTALGDNGIANAAASADCAGGCLIEAEPSYPSVEVYPAPQAWNSSVASGTHLSDKRGGGQRDTFVNPVGLIAAGVNNGETIDHVVTRDTVAAHQQSHAEEIESHGLMVTQEALAGGSNLFPGTLETVPYFKADYSALALTGSYNAAGQHSLAAQTINCYGVGDCLIGSQFLNASGGFRDEADEGAHPFDLQIHEDARVFQGVCSGGCTTGSTQVTLTPTQAGGTQGEGRFLIDTNPAKVITSGSITGGADGGGIASAVAFSGTSFPVSVFMETAQLIPSQADNVAPGTVTVGIVTSGVPSGFVTNTASISSPSGVLCIVDRSNGFQPHNYEMATYSVVDGTHLRMTLNKVHSAQATIAVGGLCGYGLEQTVDTKNGIRQVFPVLGSYSSTGLYYAGGLSALAGVSGSTSAFVNLNLPIAAIARSGNVVTVTTAGNLPVDVNGLSMTVSGVTDSSYNGTFSVTTTGPNTLTYPGTGANSTSTGGNVRLLTGGYALYPMAEVLSVYNASTKSVDGQMTLAPNNVAWSPNDSVEQPHYYQEMLAADITYVGQTTPRPTTYLRAGVQYEGNTGPGVRGWSIANATPASNYLGNGGTHTLPDFAFEALGPWRRTFDMQAGDEAAFAVHCNSHGCGRWNSGYQLFELDSAAGIDFVTYQPPTSNLSFTMRGTSYAFSPLGFSAGTVNATTLNATTVNATTVNGALNAAQLPVFGASGGGHSQGAVPDPGPVSGASRYLREDGTWTTPPAGGGSGSGSSGSTAALPVSGANVDYRFMDGSGTMVSDASGNGNNGTLGAGSLAPSWTGSGLAFTTLQNVSLPAALNSNKTMCSGVYMTPISSIITLNNFAAMVTSSLGTGGVNLMYNLTGSGYPGVFAPAIASGNSNRTSGGNVVSGFHVMCYVLGGGSGDLDHLYIDGQETFYYAQDASYGYQSSGHYYLGSSGVSAWAGSGFNGTYYRFAAWPTGLNAQQIAAVSGSIREEIALRGVDVTPRPVMLSSPQLLAAGTSLTIGAGLTPSQAWPSNLTLTNQPAYTVRNYGISGLTLLAISGNEANRFAPYCRTQAGPSIYILQAGDNDFATFGSATAQSVFASMAATTQIMKQAGCRVYLMTGFSKSGTDAAGRTFDTDKDAYDAVILTNWKVAGADGVIDAGAIQPMGCDGCNTNATYFQPDNTHPTVAGQLLVANAVNNVLNYASGYNGDDPNVVTTLPYTMTAADGYVSLNGVTGAGTLTLPDCTGQSGAVYRINNPQSTYAVSVKAGNANQLINGLPAATTVTVPGNGLLTLRDVPNPKTVSGCHWEM
jgi:lysophospholipase L1-like esterase